MPIPASHIVQVLPRVITGGSANLELNGLLFSENPIISASTMALEFPSAAAVGAYFGTDSPEYEAAAVYFASFNSKQAAPRRFFVARRVSTAIPAWLRGAKYPGTLAQLKAVTDGAMVVSIDSTALSLTALDFSAASSFSDVATAIGAALVTAGAAGATVTYSSLNGAFTITSGTSGAASVVSYAAAPASGTDLAAMLGLREEDGAILSAGRDALDVPAQMAAVLDKTQNFVSFMTAWEADADEMLEWAQWASQNFGWLYVAHSTDAAIPSPDSTGDAASLLKASGYDHTAIIYGGLDYAAFLMGVVASVAWERLNGTITAAFKRQSGLAAVVTDETAANALKAKNCNYFGNFATRNAEFVFLYDGKLSHSEYGYIDPYINAVWLNNRLQVALMDGLSTAGRVPYNTRGYTMIRAWMADPVNAARNNAAIEPGVTLSEAQKSELFNEAGLDISGELWAKGYYLQILDPGAEVRAKRESPVINLWYTYAGSVQKLDVVSTAVL
jgi:hypothetical protein